MPCLLRIAATRFTVVGMGAWGYKALENDAGLNELELLLGKSNLVGHIRKSLSQDIHECPDEIRAVAYLVYVLAKHELWQHDCFDEIVQLATRQLECILSEKIYTNVNFVGEVIHLKNQLREFAPKRGIDPDFRPLEP